MADDIKFKVLASVVGGQAIDNLRKSVDSTAKSATDINSRFGAATSAVKGFAAAFVASTAVQYVKSLIDLGDELQALSEKTGIASNQLYGFKIAASTANLSFESLQGGLAKFSKNLGGVQSGNKEVIAAFNSLGVSAKDSSGKLRGSGDIIVDLAGKFEKLKDGPEKARLAVALFGKSGVDLIPFLNQGKEALQEFSNVFDEGFGRRADAFNDSLAILGAKMQVIGINAADSLLPALQDITKAFITLPSDGKGAIDFFDAVGEVARLVSLGIFTIYDGIKEVLDTSVTGYKELKALISGDFAEIDRLDKELSDRRKKRVEDLVSFTTKITKNSLIFGEGTVDEIKQRAKDQNTPAPRKASGVADISGLNPQKDTETESIKKFIAVQAEQIDQEKLKLEQYRLSKVEYDKLIEAKKIDIEVSKASANFSELNKQKYREAAEAVKEQRKALLDLQQAQRESFSVGAQESLNEYIDSVKDVASQTKKLFSDAFQGMEDALIKFTKTGKLSFTDLANSIIDDLIRIAIRQGVTGPLASAFGSIFSSGGGAGFSFSGATASAFANGGIMTARGSLPLHKFASGGVANTPQMAIFGEGRMPEAYVPLPDGRNIPVKMEGQKGGDVFHIAVSVDASGQTQVSGGSQSGADLGKAISAAVQAELIKQRRPGGILAG